MSYWVWTFGDLPSLEWVVSHNQMGFPDYADKAMKVMAEQDRAVLYVTSGATGKGARFCGIVQVTSSPVRLDSELQIAHRSFPFACSIRVLERLPIDAGPKVEDLAANLAVVGNPDAYWNYFMPSPTRIAEADFLLLEGAIRKAAE